jgi:signal transduction histidine kinase
MLAPKQTSLEIESGRIGFSIESRIIRELGERLVKQPEVALLELIKNAYDADSGLCEIFYDPPSPLVIVDTGVGMTLEQFTGGWMRIGTSSKEGIIETEKYGRTITGEKGIGRFAVRFLGKSLHLESVAYDKIRGFKTLLVADFDWPNFDKSEDLGKIKVPYRLMRVDDARVTGTILSISTLRPNAKVLDLHVVKTASMDVVTPYHALLGGSDGDDLKKKKKGSKNINRVADPGFSLKIHRVAYANRAAIANTGMDGESEDVARQVLDHAVLRVSIKLIEDRVKLEVFEFGNTESILHIEDKYPNEIGHLFADIRFFPRRKGTFTNMPVNGKKAEAWVRDNSGVAVFDRAFRVHPYGTEGDDWLSLSSDSAKRLRHPRSTVATKHFPMDAETNRSTQLNYMLRLPNPYQLVGVVQVRGRRINDAVDEDVGLIASADREGFVANLAFDQLWDLVRGGIEALAFVDRDLQQKKELADQEDLVDSIRKEAQEAIREIQSNPSIAKHDKDRIIRALAQTQIGAEEFEQRAREREASLEVMSLLGVVAGFMTHEFGVAIDALGRAHEKLVSLAPRDSTFREAAEQIATHLSTLREFVTYSQGYIRGAAARPSAAYLVRPRVQQVIRVFGKYASERNISIELEIDSELVSPLVPVSLYNGIALNLYTNALKAVTAKAGPGPRVIAFRSWNEANWHNLEVSDTGIGIPSTLRHRVFDPLFTTTENNRDPLGSGMGLGLALVKRGAESFGGKVEVVEPPAGFSTCFRLRLPLKET